MPHPKEALYIRLPNWIGDVCMVLPALHALAATHEHIYLCARPWAQELLGGLPVTGFLPMRSQIAQDRSTLMTQRQRSGERARGLLFPDSLSSALVFRLAGIPSAGYRDDGRSLLLKWPLAKSRQPMHAVQSWYRLAALAQQTWGLPDLPAEPARTLDLPIVATQQDQARAGLQQQGLLHTPFVLIAPTATGLHKGRVKIWPHYAELTRRLQAQGLRVVYCVPPNEQAQAQANAPGALALPPMSIGSFAALTRLAELVICNDSGVSHLAAAARARQITLFGVTSAKRTGPWSPRAVCMGDDSAWPEPDDVVQRALAMIRDDVPA